jgi:hypothetical protein
MLARLFHVEFDNLAKSGSRINGSRGMTEVDKTALEDGMMEENDEGGWILHGRREG